MRAMVTAVLATVVAAMAFASGAIAKPTRSGKVVRVERPRTFERARLLICQMETSQIGLGDCYGGIPAISDEAEVYDLNGYQGRIRVSDVKPVLNDVCSGDSGGQVHFDYIEGQGNVTGSYQRLMVFGGGTDRESSHSVDPYGGSGIKSPSSNTSEAPWMILDRNGDGVEDLMSTVYQCPTIAPPNPYQGSATTGYNTVWCIDYWRREGSSWDKLRQDYFYSCN